MSSLTQLRREHPRSWLLEYIDRCRCGETLVGRELMQQLDILLGHFDDPEIQVDFADAHKRIRFIETKCRHSEAPFAGKPFVLELFQKAFIESIYSFRIYDDELGRWVRKYQDVLYLVGRKNGKTPLIAAICLAEFFCGSLGLKILCSSNDYEQADLMFQAIDNMREGSPSLERVTRRNIKGIYFGNPKKPKRKGKFSYINKGSIRKISARTGAKEGRNLGMAAADEIHELKDNSSIMPIRQALSTQEEPLFVELTTEGFIDGYLSERLKDARQALDGELERPRWLIWLYTQDSEPEIWADERSWVKSNPGLGAIKKWSFLRQMVDEARGSAATRAFVLAKDFNVRQSSASAWLLPEEIENAETFDIESLRGCFAIGGVDLSKSGDLTSARVMVMVPGSPKKYMVQRYFIPESKLETLSADDQKMYREWIEQGLVEISPGNENDFSLVTAWFVKLFRDYGIRAYKIGYDKWGAVYWAKEMDEYGFDCVRIDQTWGSMSDPMRLVEADLKSKLIVYNANPIDKYCLANTALNMNAKAEIMPVKMQESQKIDGAVTMVIAYRVYVDNRSEYLRLVGGR